MDILDNSSETTFNQGLEPFNTNTDTLSEETKKKINRLIKQDTDQLTRNDVYWEKMRREDPERHRSLTAQRFSDAIRLGDKFLPEDD